MARATFTMYYFMMSDRGLVYLTVTMRYMNEIICMNWTNENGSLCFLVKGPVQLLQIYTQQM